ncbi:MAG TPA: 50S ribosomal protein L21 [Longimicrobiales bacterium]|nr:50S ribosomal protein L21 [Longimicrobiales bacterium]
MSREPSKYAVFSTGGKQFRAEPGARLRIPTLEAEPGTSVVFDRVLLAGDGQDTVQVGTPIVEGASVKAEVLRHGRADKVIVFKRKRRKNYRRKQGHRQGFTEIRVEDVALA